MKVIFLDNDGVICLGSNWGSRHKKQREFVKKNNKVPYEELPIDCQFDNFDRKAIKVLNDIIEKTGAEIVISSDWRKYASVEELGEYYLKQGIVKAPISATRLGTEVVDEFDKLNEAHGSAHERVLEIQDWLKRNEVTHWVAIDDINMSVKSRLNYSTGENEVWGLENFVHTPKVTEGIKQSGLKDKILKYLT